VRIRRDGAFWVVRSMSMLMVVVMLGLGRLLTRVCVGSPLWWYWCEMSELGWKRDDAKDNL